MNKFWSVLFFAVALILSWNLINTSSAIGSETHSGIQSELSALLLDTVQMKKPEARNIHITRMWTETLDDHKVRAVFAYSFSEGPAQGPVTEQTIEGEAILHREPSEDPRLDRWILQQVHTTGDSVSFSEGTVITPTPGEDETDPTAPPSKEPVPAAEPAEHH